MTGANLIDAKLDDERGCLKVEIDLLELMLDLDPGMILWTPVPAAHHRR